MAVLLQRDGGGCSSRTPSTPASAGKKHANRDAERRPDVPEEPPPGGSSDPSLRRVPLQPSAVVRLAGEAGSAEYCIGGPPPPAHPPPPPATRTQHGPPLPGS